MNPGRALIWWLVLLALVAGGLWWGRQEPEPMAEVAISQPPANGGTMTVHVGGWVAQPGLVELVGGARVADAIAAAGGSLPGAELAAINLAATLVDGEQILVPGPREADPPPDGSPAASGPLRLNQATAEELDDLPGIGPVIAERIVDFREANGPFQTVEDLLDVAGIGEAKLASIRDLIVP